MLTVEKSLAEARAEGAMALFGEKYGEHVRTVTVKKDGDRYSYELCGGCHVNETGQIGAFIITAEGSVSAGIRRVEALTGHGAVEYIQRSMNTLGQLASQLSTSPDQVGDRIAALQNELTTAKKHAAVLQRELAKKNFDVLVSSNLEQVNGAQALIARLDDIPPDMLREMSDWFRNAVKSGRHGFDFLMIGGDTVSHQAIRRRQAVEHIDLDDDLGVLKQTLGRVETGRACTNNGDAQRLRRCSNLRHRIITLLLQ